MKFNFKFNKKNVFQFLFWILVPVVIILVYNVFLNNKVEGVKMKLFNKKTVKDKKKFKKDNLFILLSAVVIGKSSLYNVGRYYGGFMITPQNLYFWAL